MLEVITYINENDCTTDLEKQLYEVALDYLERVFLNIMKELTMKRERKK